MNQRVHTYELHLIQEHHGVDTKPVTRNIAIAIGRMSDWPLTGVLRCFGIPKRHNSGWGDIQLYFNQENEASNTQHGRVARLIGAIVRAARLHGLNDGQRILANTAHFNGLRRIPCTETMEKGTGTIVGSQNTQTTFISD